MYSAVGKARMVSPEQKKLEWDRAVKNIHKVSKLAQERGLEIALEPLNRFESDLINTAEDIMRLINDVNHPAAKVLLDGFHMAIEERDLEKAIMSVGDKLIHVQVSENYRGTPGTGQTPGIPSKKDLLKSIMRVPCRSRVLHPRSRSLREPYASGRTSPVARMSLLQRDFLF